MISDNLCVINEVEMSQIVTCLINVLFIAVEGMRFYDVICTLLSEFSFFLLCVQFGLSKYMSYTFFKLYTT